MITPIEEKIRTYAFTHQCDFDEATYKVLAELMYSLANHDVEGLYDRLFQKGDKASVP